MARNRCRRRKDPFSKQHSIETYSQGLQISDYQTQTIKYLPAQKPHSHQQSLPISLPSLRPLLIHFLSLETCLLWIFHINGSIHRAIFVMGFLHFAKCFQDHTFCSAYQYFIPFYGSVKRHCMEIPHLLCPFLLFGFYE